MPMDIGGGFPWSDFSPSNPGGSVGLSGQCTVTRRGWTEHENLPTAIEFFLGSVLQETDAVGVTYLKRVLQHQYPAALSSDPNTDAQLFATMVSWSAEGRPGTDAVSNPNSPIGKATVAACTVTYSALTYDVLTDDEVLDPTDNQPHDLGNNGASRYITKIRRNGGRIQTIRGGGLKFADTGEVLVENLPFPIASGDITYIWHGTPSVPYTAIGKALNHVNSGTFDSIFPAETILLKSHEVRPWVHPCAGRVYDITYHFGYEPNATRAGVVKGWNYKYHRVGGQIEPGQVVTSDSGNPVFPTFNMRTLFRPDQ